MDALVVLVVSLGFGLLWLSSARHKLRDFEGFKHAMGEYGLLPAWSVRAAAISIVILELALGVSWLGGWFTPIASVMTALLLAVYACAMAINLIRGRVHIDCGCAGAGSGQPLTTGLVVRNLVLVAFALTPLIPGDMRDLGWADVLVAIPAVATAVLLYTGLSRLLVNAAGMASWRVAR